MIDCLDRAFEGKEPLPSRKWKGIIKDGNLYLFHYHHLVLVYHLDKNVVEHMWWETPTDKRGLMAALQYLEERNRKNEKTVMG